MSKGSKKEFSETLSYRLLCFLSGYPNQGRGKNAATFLKRLVFTAARIGAAPFIRIVFSTSAGPTIYEMCKNESPLPEEVAAANGHDHIAVFLRTQANKYEKIILFEHSRGDQNGYERWLTS